MRFRPVRLLRYLSSSAVSPTPIPVPPSKRRPARPAHPRPDQVAAAYCLGGELPLPSVRDLLANSHTAPTSALSHLRPAPTQTDPGVLHAVDERGSDRHAFFFASGPTVYWGLTMQARRTVEDAVAPLRAGAGAVARPDIAMEEFDHEFSFHMVPDVGQSVFRDDTISLRATPDADPMELLAISYGLAQSVYLLVYEEAIDRLVERTEGIPGDLAHRGAISLRPRDIKKRIGELLAARYAVNLLTDIVDTPEFFWDHPELSSLFSQTSSEVDLRRRAGALDKRMTIMKDMLDALNDELATGASSRVERAILLLIAIEVALEIAGRLF